MRDPNQFLRQALIPLLSVAAGIGVLAILIYWIRVWFYDNDDSAGSTHELLTEYYELNRRGELTDEEYRIIKSRMAPQIGPTGTATGAAARKPLQKRVSPNDAAPPRDNEPSGDAMPSGDADEGQAE
jgi:hypothetical protein